MCYVNVIIRISWAEGGRERERASRGETEGGCFAAYFATVLHSLVD